MFKTQDLILLVVVFTSMVTGITLPEMCRVFQPFPLYLLMLLLFFSFFSIRIEEIRDTFSENALLIFSFSALKLAALPLLLYWICSIVHPPYALAVLLVTGISTGVVAPFMATLLGANGPTVLIMVVITSLAVPFTLPAVVKIAVGRGMEISAAAMIRTLSEVIFIPLAASTAVRRLNPGLVATILRIRFYVSLVIFGLINLGVFSRYSSFFLQNPLVILEATLVACLLGIILLATGIAFFWKRPAEYQLAGCISLCNMNNLLVIVFAVEFFGPLEPTLAAVYMVPFFGLILPLRFYKHISQNSSAAG